MIMKKVLYLIAIVQNEKCFLENLEKPISFVKRMEVETRIIESEEKLPENVPDVRNSLHGSCDKH